MTHLIPNLRKFVDIVTLSVGGAPLTCWYPSKCVCKGLHYPRVIVEDWRGLCYSKQDFAH